MTKRSNPPDTTTALAIREATEADRANLVAMLGRCSHMTRLHRFGGHVRDWPEPFLTECLSRPSDEHDALVLVTPDREPRVIGLATAARLSNDRDVTEISLLVEDAWQRHGLAHRLLDSLLNRAAGRGIRRLSFQVNADQGWLVALARTHMRLTKQQSHGNLIIVEAALALPSGS